MTERTALQKNIVVDRGYIAEIDGLRAIAVISVVIFHLAPSILPGGFAGVDIFFVISGYVVSMSLARDTNDGFFRYLQKFYARRFVRLLPALVACLLITTFLSALVIPHSWLSNTNQKTISYAFFGLSNFALLSADNYFSPRPEFNPATHTWSLAVEEQFYLIFPVVIFTWARLRNIRSSWRLLAWGLTPLLSIVSFGALIWLDRVDKLAAFYLLLGRFWELGIGALLFQASTSQEQALVLWRRGAFASLGFGVMVTAIVFADSAAFPFPWAIPVVLGTGLTIVGLSTPNRGGAVGRVLRSPAMIFIGQISYSLYLWHWPVLVLFRWTAGLRTYAEIGAAAALTILLAVLSFFVLEQPVRNHRLVRVSPRWVVIAVGVSMLVVSWEFSRNLDYHSDWVSLSRVTRDKEMWYPDPVPIKSACSVKYSIGTVGGGIRLVWQPTCMQPATTQHRIFVVGDSHASAYQAMLWQLANERGIGVAIYTRSNCWFANLLRPAPPECAEFVKASANDILQRASAGDIVFLAALRMNRLGNQWGPYSSSQVEEEYFSVRADVDRRHALDEAVALIAPFAKKGLRVVVDAPKPVFKAPAFRCSDWFNAENPACDGGLEVAREELDRLRAPVMASMQQLLKIYPELTIWDAFPLLCPRERCRAVSTAGPLFFDGDHLSGLANRVLYPAFEDLLDKIWSEERHPVIHRQRSPRASLITIRRIAANSGGQPVVG